jgi:hypothetical protein
LVVVWGSQHGLCHLGRTLKLMATLVQNYAIVTSERFSELIWCQRRPHKTLRVVCCNADWLGAGHLYCCSGAHLELFQHWGRHATKCWEGYLLSQGFLLWELDLGEHVRIDLLAVYWTGVLLDFLVRRAGWLLRSHFLVWWFLFLTFHIF